jgi:hypothetical protein
MIAAGFTGNIYIFQPISSAASKGVFFFVIFFNPAARIQPPI